MKCLIMLTGNWTDTEAMKKAPDISAWIDNYIGNTGNLMFMNAARFIAGLPGNSYEFYDWYKMNGDADAYKKEINENYDCVLYPMANVLQGNTQYLQNVIRLIKGITIPVFVLGIGITLDEGVTVHELFQDIQQPVQEFLDIVGKSGGAIGCRGYMTKELLDKAGAGELVTATGCPSLYQNGILHISEDRVPEESFRVALNGRVQDFTDRVYRKAFEDKKAVYICQDQYGKAFYGKKMSLRELISQYGYIGTEIFINDRVKYFPDLRVWQQYISSHVDFSFGTRIHGNLITLLAGKPACVYLRKGNTDLRVKELADFFAVPVVKDMKKRETLYQLYTESDYSTFNRTFETNFRNFEEFLKKHGLCESLPTTKNPVFSAEGKLELTEQTNREELREEWAHLGKIQKFMYEKGIKK